MFLDYPRGCGSEILSKYVVFGAQRKTSHKCRKTDLR